MFSEQNIHFVFQGDTNLIPEYKISKNCPKKVSNHRGSMLWMC